MPIRTVLTLEATERLHRERLAALPQNKVAPGASMAEYARMEMFLSEDAHVFTILDHQVYGVPAKLTPSKYKFRRLSRRVPPP